KNPMVSNQRNPSVSQLMKEYIKKIKRVNPTVLLLLATFLVISLLRATKDEPEVLVIPEKSWPVSVIEAQYSDVQPTLSLFGEVITSRRSELRSLVGGQVVQVGENFKEGAVVEKGELLLRIDDFEYRNAVIEESAKLEVMNRDFDRADELFKQGNISEQFRDNALLEKTKQELVLSEVEKDLRDTELFAPFDGVINDVQATLGKQVNTLNDKIGEIIDIKNMEVRFSLSKAQYGRLLEDTDRILGRKIEMSWTVGKRDLVFNASVSRVGAEITSNTGGVNIFANIVINSGEESPLRPGAFVRLKMPDKTYESVVSIPETAVYEDKYIFIVNDQRLKKIMIEILGYDQSKVLIKPLDDSKIKNGDYVVVNQLREAGENVKVDII
ncbi:efflux RND transporter periplasmic adaptor subunit, partial [Gammaproteobacteria bacterium]|nr:efflux RND transporter periplasmic adaptor subunit [Gammaproteobacteria bacterium]